jgi:hypothetical protein
VRYILVLLITVNFLNAQSFNYKGLLWQDNSEVTQREYEQKDAREYCLALELDGYSDWRLPDIKELFMIVNLSKRDPAVISGIEKCNSDYYWSNTIFASDKYSYWSVDFSTGKIKSFSPGSSFYVRCVR